MPKLDFKPKRYHGYSVLLFILGSLLPPLAVAARFGIGGDFWLNLLLTLCGYIPGHVHNFYIQNVRNNKNNRRTPKWAQRYGLVDTSAMDRKKKKSEWAKRYDERLPASVLEGQAYEEGQVPGTSTDPSAESLSMPRGTGNGELWNSQEESYYGQQPNSSSTSVHSGESAGRWRYPANFDDTVVTSVDKKKKKEKKDRWARTEDAYSIGEDAGRKKKKKKRSSKSVAGDPETYSRASDSNTEFPEDAGGGLYGDHSAPADSAISGQQDELSHQF